MAYIQSHWHYQLCTKIYASHLVHRYKYKISNTSFNFIVIQSEEKHKSLLHLITSNIGLIFSPRLTYPSTGMGLTSEFQTRTAKLLERQVLHMPETLIYSNFFE